MPVITPPDYISQIALSQNYLMAFWFSIIPISVLYALSYALGKFVGPKTALMVAL